MVQKYHSSIASRPWNLLHIHATLSKHRKHKIDIKNKWKLIIKHFMIYMDI